MDWDVTRLRGVPWGHLERAHQALRAQVRELPERRHLLLSEPLPTFTAGRSALPEEQLWEKERLAREGIQVHSVSRGGKWTYHGPGQLLAYPLLDVRTLGLSSKSTRALMERFRGAVVEWLGQWNVDCDPVGDRPFGVYVGGSKLVSFGTAIEHSVTAHGMALYLTDQSAPFQGIVACGVSRERFTSLEALGLPADWEWAAEGLTAFLKKYFNS